MPYSAIDIANFFVRIGQESQIPCTLTPMQVVKLTFLAHGWNLGLTGKPLVNEPVQAWKFGPVLPSVYFAFQEYGSGTIQGPVSHMLVNDGRFTLRKADDLPKFDSADEKLLRSVFATYSKYSGPELSTLTHKPGSPWYERTQPFRSKGLDLPRFLQIPDEMIERYYKKKADENKRRAAN